MINIKVISKSFLLLLTLLTLLPLSADAEPRKVRLNISYELAERLPMSDFDLYLLSTVTGSENGTKAVLKNPVNERISSYRVGEYVSILGEDVRVVSIFPCMSVLEQNGRYFKLYCKSEIVDNSYFKVHSLVGYKIGEPRHLFLSNAFDGSFDHHIISACKRYGVDPYLVKAIIRAESNFDPDAVSPKNAQGLMQIMPATAKDYEVDNTFDPGTNIEGGVRILKDLIEYFDGNIKLALAAYNAGKYAVIKYNNQVPPYPETQQYVSRVLAFYSDIKSDKIN